ncbi:DUF1127 domain-containing protein [Bradyrhizobium sp. I71]|uniref:DUF1127 domain-containing protein n=1 Tax=Bradyrhizobium sp. I71 TaxID=2590772 RepID=UPI001EF767B6|nr:DUF1127 domain-containing protein [Bradyrhizobium sp. I71]ULK99201.1 DUF1127 domain-containing protein [Bradyrhizobium sp. I71]
MPPQLTNSTADPAGDAARLRLDLVTTPDVRSFLTQYWRAYQEWRWRHRPQTTLQDLSDRELLDIGLTRCEIDSIAPERAIDRLRDSTRYLLSRGGM